MSSTKGGPDSPPPNVSPSCTNAATAHGCWADLGGSMFFHYCPVGVQFTFVTAFQPHSKMKPKSAYGPTQVKQRENAAAAGSFWGFFFSF